METQTTPVVKNIEELTITIAAKKLSPSMLSPDFLKHTGIVPSEWELARDPITNTRGRQINFKNGLNVIAQPGSISFIEALSNKDFEKLQFSQVATQYINKLPNAEYQALSIGPKIIVPFEGEEGGKNFISEKLLADGPWQKFGDKPPQAALNLFYQLAQCQLSLNINPAKLQQPDETVISAILFAGNFTYPLTNIAATDKINKLSEIINNWTTDLKTFRELVYEKFLQKALPQQESLFQ